MQDLKRLLGQRRPSFRATITALLALCLVLQTGVIITLLRARSDLPEAQERGLVVGAGGADPVIDAYIALRKQIFEAGAHDFSRTPMPIDFFRFFEIK